MEDACAMIERGDFEGDRVLVVYLPTCHESIAGIVAGRLRERYYKPTFVVTDTNEGQKAQDVLLKGILCLKKW